MALLRVAVLCCAALRYAVLCCAVVHCVLRVGEHCLQDLEPLLLVAGWLAILNQFNTCTGSGPTV